jgi:hypothetical protein
VAYEYHAAANLNFHNLADAEKSGLRAVDIDKTIASLGCTLCWLKSMKRKVTPQTKQEIKEELASLLRRSAA